MNSHIWSLAAVSLASGEERTAALLLDGAIYAIDVLPENILLIDVIRRWDSLRSKLSAWRVENAPPIKGAEILAPLRYPNKLICVGANYQEHRAEMKGAPTTGSSVQPFFLMKPPTTTIVGPGADIKIRGEADRVDWEAEIGVVIGKRGRDIASKDAMDHIAGYTLVNDVSARGAHASKNPIHPAFAFDWVASKAQDTFCPMGPGIVPAWAVDDPADIPFSLAVNGAIEQSGSTKDLITDIRSLIVSLSQLMTLEEGDVIATGTPSGVGMAKGRFLVDGDVVTLSSPLIGSFSNTVRALQ